MYAITGFVFEGGVMGVGNGSIGIEHFDPSDDSIERYMEESKEEEVLDSDDAETGSESFGNNGSIGIEHVDLSDDSIVKHMEELKEEDVLDSKDAKTGSESFGSNGSIGIDHFESINDSIEQHMEELKEEEMLDSEDAEVATEKDGEEEFVKMDIGRMLMWMLTALIELLLTALSALLGLAAEAIGIVVNVTPWILGLAAVVLGIVVIADLWLEQPQQGESRYIQWSTLHPKEKRRVLQEWEKQRVRHAGQRDLSGLRPELPAARRR